MKVDISIDEVYPMYTINAQVTSTDFEVPVELVTRYEEASKEFWKVQALIAKIAKQGEQ